MLIPLCKVVHAESQCKFVMINPPAADVSIINPLYKNPRTCMHKKDDSDQYNHVTAP